jgi:DNA-binding IclR family transcriptional regulator
VLSAFSAAPMPEPPGGLQAITDHTITSWSQWTAALSRVREQGYATNIEELEYGYVSVAAPVYDREGRTTVSLSIGGSVHRVTGDRIPALAASVQQAAARLSNRLGFRTELNGPDLAAIQEPR